MVAYALVRQGTGIDATTVGVNSYYALPKAHVADIYPTYASVEEINGAGGRRGKNDVKKT
jgi:hypothetical protein